MRWEASARGLLFSRANENNDDATLRIRSATASEIPPAASQGDRGRRVVGQGEVSVKPGEDIQSAKLILIWQLSHSFDHTNGRELYALHRGDASS